jgi:type I restriction enzyme R subunit
MVDEAHRTQEGDLGRKMRSGLPNAFLFGLTGTSINKADKNTFGLLARSKIQTAI